MLSAGTKLGPYEIAAAIGAGGMGEVYRARDTRLGRDVAVKVLPAALSSDADRLRRFEQEARATATLNHPNILAVFDIGSSNGAPFVVSELLEGSTLRERLRGGALPVRKAIEIAVQIAHGLAAAHEKGILHRDLKPENLFLTRDGRAKILDFGLAKLTEPESRMQSMATAESGTDAGTVLGTLGYMSAEQVRGLAVDSRSDIFSFGAILYEMLSGKRAFHGATSADTISAILKEDPPDLVETNRNVSPALERIVRHCLEKNPEQRFHSASDLAFDLESVSATSGTAIAQSKASKPARSLRAPALATLFFFALAAAFLLGRRAWQGNSHAVPQIQQLTFRRGTVLSARFAPDGRTVVYSAAWEGNPAEIFSTSAQSPESRSTDIKDASLLAISSTGQLAIKQRPHIAGPFARLGTLAVVPLSGGAPRALLASVEGADFSPDGGQLAVIQYANGLFSVQYPVGKVLFSAPYWLSHVRVSPDGRRVAFISHPFGGDEGSVMLAGEDGKTTELSGGFLSAQGLAWSPKGDELWFTATRNGANRSLYAVSTMGKERVIERVPGTLTLYDVLPSGNILLGQAYDRLAMVVLLPGSKEERDLSWFDYSLPAAVSRDGKLVLLGESGEGGGPGYSVYLRPTDGSPAVRLGEGFACDLSPDGKFALGRSPSAQGKLLLLPTLGVPRDLNVGNMNVGCGRFLLDDHTIVFSGQEPGHKFRVYWYDFEAGAAPKPVTPEGVANQLGIALTEDRKFIISADDSGRSMLYPVEGGPPRSIKGVLEGEDVFGSSQDGKYMFTRRRGEMPQKVFKIDQATGKRELWRLIGPADRTGVSTAAPPLIFAGGQGYLCAYNRNLSELYLVQGLE